MRKLIVGRGCSIDGIRTFDGDAHGLGPLAIRIRSPVVGHIARQRHSKPSSWSIQVSNKEIGVRAVTSRACVIDLRDIDVRVGLEVEGARLLRDELLGLIANGPKP